MGVIKKILVGTVIVGALAGAGYAGLHYIKQSNQKTIMVVPVSSLQSDYYSSDTTLEGNITTNVSQNISVGNDIIIEDVYVNKGDVVNKGDKLMTFDTTLVQMELEIAKLKHQKLEIDLNKAVNRLNSLKNGGPIEENDSSTNFADRPSSSRDFSSSMDDAGSSTLGWTYKSAIPLFAAAAVSDSGLTQSKEAETDIEPLEETVENGDELSSQPDRGQTESGLMNGDVVNDTTMGSTEGSQDDITSGGGSSVPYPTSAAPSPTPALIDPTALDGLTDGTVHFYDVLDYASVPYTGTGTEEDPFVFLASSHTGYVTVMGSFFNRMAGYSEDGGLTLYEGGYWYTIEFHKDDTISDPDDRKASCVGYYFINGSLLQKSVNPFVETELTMEEALQYNTEDDLPDDPSFDPGSGGTSATMTRAEAIKYQQQKIQRLQLDIKESDINIGKLEKRVAQTEIFARLDGIVSYVGDPLTGKSEGSSFLVVKSKEGYYLTGTVSELMRDEMTEGTVLDCMSYMSGSFEATVIGVSDYPVSGYSYWGDGNPNVSYYTYTAEISDQSMQFGENDYVTVTMRKDAQNTGLLILSKAFVRSENGSYYVYKNDHGVLKKQPVQVGDTVNGGYSIAVKAGITAEDQIAFPYGDLAKDGTPTEEGSLESLYSY